MVARLLCMNDCSNAAEGLGFDPLHLHSNVSFAAERTAGEIWPWLYRSVLCFWLTEARPNQGSFLLGGDGGNTDRRHSVDVGTVVVYVCY